MTINRVALLRESRISYSVIWSQFILSYSKEPDTLYCFFEGEDSKYYSVRIDMFIGDSLWRGFNCHGKDSVIELYHLITSNKEYKNSWIALFIYS